MSARIDPRCFSHVPTCKPGKVSAACVEKVKPALSGQEVAVASRRVVRSLRKMGDRLPRYRGHWQDTTDPFDLGPLSDERPEKAVA